MLVFTNAQQTFKSTLKTIARKYVHDFKPMNDLFSVFTKSDFTILKRLSRDRNVYITKPGKGCDVVLIRKIIIKKFTVLTIK